MGVHPSISPSIPHYLIIDLNATRATDSKQASSACKNSAQYLHSSLQKSQLFIVSTFVYLLAAFIDTTLPSAMVK